MLIRWSVAALLAASVLVSALELSACAVSRATGARTTPAASVGRIAVEADVDAGLPTAPEVDGPAPSMSPELTY